LDSLWNHRKKQLKSNSVFFFGARTDFPVGNLPNSVAVGDFNGDTKLDLAVVHVRDGVSILLGDGAGSFGTKTDFPLDTDAVGIAIGDFG